MENRIMENRIMENRPQPADGQCNFFLTKKKRFCRFRPNDGQKYCPEHACLLGVELERKRIVCPLNPKHTCYQDSLDKHLKKCNSRKRKMEDYYEEGINTGTDDEGDTVVTNSQMAVKTTDTERLRQMIQKVNQLYEEHIGEVTVDIGSHDCLKEEMDNPHFGLSALRHRRQQSSLIGQLDGLGLLEAGHCYVEMGAGKGQLSHWVRKAVSGHDDASFLLVDRSSIRYKMDGYHKEEENVKFERIKVDIEHLNLGKVPMVENSDRPLVAIGKHLCGAATDLSLRCLMTADTSFSTSQPSAKRPRTQEGEVPAECSGVVGTAAVSDSSVTPGAEREVEATECGDSAQTNAVGDGRKDVTCHGASTGADRISHSQRDKNSSNSQGDQLGSNSQGDQHSSNSQGDQHSSNSQDDQHSSNSQGDTSTGNRGGAGCVESQSQTAVSDVGGQNAPANKQVRVVGVLLALCCHHQCRWRAYVGKPFMRQCGITTDDFNLLTRLSSWAVCGWRNRDGSFGSKEDKGVPAQDTQTSSGSTSSSRNQPDQDTSGAEDTEHDTQDLLGGTNQIGGQNLTEKQKERVGWRCKRLIDYGRVRYLQDHGLHSDLRIYIDTQQTPENVVLIAVAADKTLTVNQQTPVINTN